jgi:ABC-type maltose transport systems, permease component
MSKHPSSVKRSHTIGLVWRWALAAVLILFSIFPVLWIVSASINPVNDLANQKLIPDNWSFENFRQLVTNPISPFSPG